MTPILCILALGLQAKAPLLMNGGFDSDLSGWKAEGDARVTSHALTIGPGKGAVRQRYNVPGLRILLFGANLKPSEPSVVSRVRIQCFDAKNRLVMDLDGGPDAKGGAGVYLKTQAHTTYVVLSIEKRSAGGVLVADNAYLQDDDKDRVEHAPQVDLDDAMLPIWKGDKVVDESVLLLSKEKGVAGGKLLFKPARVISLKDTSRRKEYIEGKDFTIEGNTIVAIKGSGIPTMSDSEFSIGEFPWTRLDGRHVFVTYEHKDPWPGPIPAYQGGRLPETVAKLKAKKPLTIVAYGDSITLGVNVTGFLNVPPYLPPWPTLVARQLGKAYGNDRITLYNTGLGGQNSQWAKDNAKDAVASLNPDLVLIAFGMNDFWSLTPELFRKNIEPAIATIRARRPKCEFILISPMKFDPAYTTDPTYVGNLAGYAAELSKLTGKGIALFDMTAFSDALYKAKSAKDLTTDPLHPDDFLARIYAQGVVATLVKPPGP